MPGNTLEYPCQGDRERAAEVVDGVGDDGHAVGEPSADEGDDGEGEVDEEGREDVLPRAITMQMDMIVKNFGQLKIVLLLLLYQVVKKLKALYILKFLQVLKK